MAWVLMGILIPALISGQLFWSFKKYIEPRAVDDREKLETERANRQARALSHWEDFVADRRALASLPMYGPVVGGDDGVIVDARFLNLIVPWRPRLRVERTAPFTSAVDRHRDQLPVKDRDLFESLGGDVEPRMQVRSWGDDFAAHAREVTIPPHVIFLSQLRGYQRWDLEAETPRARFRPSDPVERMFDQPTPDFQILDDWAKLRLLAGLRDHQLPVAVAEVRHLARLLVTTEDPLALGLVSPLLCSIVSAERQEGLRDDQALSECNLAHRHLLAIPGQVVPGMPDPKLTVVLDQSAPGVCAAINGSLPFWQSLRHDLEPAWPAFYQRLDALVAGPSPCQLTHARTDWGPAQADTFRRLIEASRKPNTDAFERFLFWLGYRFDALVRNAAMSYAVSQLGFFEHRYAPTN